jgi:hypothetical protein
MMVNLFSANTPARFWRCIDKLDEYQWQAAVNAATPVLEMPNHCKTVPDILDLVLGEGQFGSNHWTLSPAKRIYYKIKPILPRSLTLTLRQLSSISIQENFLLNWPIEDRYVRFQWEIMRNLLNNIGKSNIPIIHFWPEGNHFAFVLTHDIETLEGQAHVRHVANLEASLGFRSSFNFVPMRYPLDYELIEELHDRGFEIGVHGLKHDGKLFSSKEKFFRRAEHINGYLKDLDAVGFRAPLTHRQPEWMQALEVEYDLSFFDTDPFEPISGGTMSIWPFEIGRFIELPYTLVQDFTLIEVLGEDTPQIWMQKVDFIQRFCGMALVNTHPDYLVNEITWNIYAEFLHAMKNRTGYWHALPKDLAQWWRARYYTNDIQSLPGAVQSMVHVVTEGIFLE